jgi:hypothetical protein
MLKELTGSPARVSQDTFSNAISHRPSIDKHEVRVKT